MKTILREIVDASLGCLYFGSYHASFVLAACAVEATAKARFPNESSSGRRVKDFLRENMSLMFRTVNLWVGVNMPEDKSSLPKDSDGHPDVPRVDDDFHRLKGEPRMVRMEGVLYHAFRCALSHEAKLEEVELLPPVGNGLQIRVDEKVRLSADVVGRLLDAVIQAPENARLFVNQSEASTE